ncbi:MAG: TIGR02677 family protein [Thermoanaerobaculia bacterium]
MPSDRVPAREAIYRPLSLFAYTVEPSAPLYRAVMALFLEAKERYRIQLRPDEVLAELAGQVPGRVPELPDRATLDRALDQLVDWGNLRRSHDTGRVATLEDFRRRHHVYQLTPAGEAAERAVGRVVESLESSGSLQRVMLGAILRNLSALADEAVRDAPRPAVLYETLFNVAEQFRALTENASTFLARLHEALDAGEVDTSAFLVYKQAVLEYLEGFVGELSELAPRIAGAIRAVEERGAGPLLALAAEADTTPTPEGRRDRSAELERQWAGVAAWFVGEGTEPPTVERLRSAARTAINRILLILERLHEQRFRRVNRTADLVRLAGWFDALEGAEGGRERAHRLFADAFGLFGARHLGGLHDDPELVRPGTSWWEAPPVPVAPVLRKTGRSAVAGRTGRVVDHSRTRRFLAERHRRERQAHLAALAVFADRGPLPLAGLSPLTRDQFDLLLALLDQLLAAPPEADGSRRARSRDGLLALRLESAGPSEGAPGAELDAEEAAAPDRRAAPDRQVAPAAAPLADSGTAVVECPDGRLALPAWTLTVESAAAVREARA